MPRIDIPPVTHQTDKLSNIKQLLSFSSYQQLVHQLCSTPIESAYCYNSKQAKVNLKFGIKYSIPATNIAAASFKSFINIRIKKIKNVY